MADVTKIKLPNNNVVNIKDYRIPGVDQVPTSGSVNLVTSGGVYQDIEDASLVTSAALNDLNDRLVDIEEDWVTTEEYSQIESAVRDTYTKQEIDVMIADLESGGVDNVVTQVNVGATPYNPSNGIVSLPAYPTTLPASDVSSWAKASTKPSYTASEVGAATQSDINTAIQNLIGTAPAALDTLGEISDALNDDANLASTLTNQISAKYTKPNTGIPKNDLASDVQTSLGKADTALQSYTETDPTVPAWAKATNKPTYTATEVGAQEVLVSGTNIKTINNQSLLGSGNLTVPIKIYEFQTTDYSSAFYGYITISWDTYQSMLSDFANGISVAIRTKCLSDDEVVAEYEWCLEHNSNGEYVFFRPAPNEYCRIFVYPPSEPGEDAPISAGSISFSNMERTSNRVTSISASSTNYTYPTAKAVYNATLSSARNIASGSQVSGWNDIISGNYSVSVSTFNSIISAYRDGTFYGYYFRNSSTVTNITFKVLFVLVGYENDSLIFSRTDNGHIYTITWKIVNNAVEKTFTDINVSDLQNTLNSKQDALVSGTNIKTINNQSLLGSGNITISGGGDTSSCVHITGDESVGGDKTFTDDIIVGDASNIKYGASSGEGFTKGYAVGAGGQATLQFSIQEEPKAFVITLSSGTAYGSGVGAIIGDSTGCRGVYAAESTSQHNYSTAFTSSYSNGTLTITPPSGATFVEEDYVIVYYYGSGTLTFRTNSIQPGSGITSVTFTGTGLTETPAMYACLLETQVNSESYRRVALYTNSTWWNSNYTSIAHTFYSQQVIDSTSSFIVSYNNGLVINSGGTNAGGYFHNPGTYTLYYLMASDIGGGGSGSYSSLADELDDKQDLLVSGNNIKTVNNNSLIGSGNVSVGTITEITMNGTSKGTSGVVNLGTVLTSETALSKGTTTGSGNAVTDISVSGHQITLTKGTTFLTSHQNISGKADLSGAAFTGVVTGTSSGNTGQFRNITISSSEPTSSSGNNGDIWIVI